eukprot:189044-Amphidinium_carterae.1
MLGQHGFLAHVFKVFETFKVTITTKLTIHELDVPEPYRFKEWPKKRSDRHRLQRGFVPDASGWLDRVAAATTAQLFQEVSIDVISTSEVTVSVTLDPGFKDVDIEAPPIRHMLCVSAVCFRTSSDLCLKAMLEQFDGIAEVEQKKGMAMLTLIVVEVEQFDHCQAPKSIKFDCPDRRRHFLLEGYECVAFDMATT